MNLRTRTVVGGPATGLFVAAFCAAALAEVAVSALLDFQAGKPQKRIPAFPGAEGFGATTPGGRGGRIIEVTNLNTSGPGSLQAACREKGPRIVVFRVSGVIEAGLGIAQPFVTIAGQTAPGDGICLRNGTLTVATHDVVIRHLRVRPGDHPFGARSGTRDCIAIEGDRARDVIIDHCSASWGMDENISTYNARNVTFQWCLSTESLLDSIHPKGPHGMGMLLGKYRNDFTTVHHCLLAHNMGRNPLFGSFGKDRKPKPPAVFDIRNNLIYNHGRYSCSNVFGDVLVNYVGNFVKMGPNGRKDRPRGLSIRLPKRQKAYVKDNIWPGKPKGQVDDWLVVGAVLDPRRKAVPEIARLRKPAATPPVATEPAAQAYESVLRFAGATRPVRDVVDARIIAEVRAGTGHIIDSQRDVGGWPTYASVAPPADSDHDGMPDAWEARCGFKANDPADGPKDRDGDGYTNVEEFLNETDPAKPDAGAAIAQRPVRVQAGNDQIRGEAARKIGKQRMAKAKKADATKESREALLKKVRESGREVADLLGIKFVRLPAGQLMIRKVKVTLTKPFELSVCEITQGQWEAVMGTRPWSGKIAAKDDPECPASYVSYRDCQEFISRLNPCGDRKYRLPTYAEWVYAARAGTDSPYGLGTDANRVPEYVWCSVKARDKQGRFARHNPVSPQAVGRLKPNPWGLYNMAGNVREWCHDWNWPKYYDVRYCSPTKTDPMGPKKRWYRVVCGGHFRFRRSQILTYRAAAHYPHYRGFDMGFRLRRSVP